MLLDLENCDYLLVNVQICLEDFVKIYNLVIFVQIYMKIMNYEIMKILKLAKSNFQKVLI